MTGDFYNDRHKEIYPFDVSVDKLGALDGICFRTIQRLSIPKNWKNND